MHKSQSVCSRFVVTLVAFAKLDQQNKLSALRGLIKLYQGEIDRLTQSSLFAETAFLSIYKDLANCPDPAPHMAGVKHDENAEREVAQLKLENERLKRELQDFRKEFQEVKRKFSKASKFFLRSVIKKSPLET